MGGGRRHGRQDKSGGSRDCKSGLVVGRRGRKVSCGTFAGASVAEFFPVGCDSESTCGERRHSGEHERWGAVEVEVAALGLKPSQYHLSSLHPTKRKSGTSRGPRLPGLMFSLPRTQR